MIQHVISRYDLAQRFLFPILLLTSHFDIFRPRHVFVSSQLPWWFLQPRLYWQQMAVFMQMVCVQVGLCFRLISLTVSAQMYEHVCCIRASVSFWSITHSLILSIPRSQSAPLHWTLRIWENLSVPVCCLFQALLS